MKNKNKKNITDTKFNLALATFLVTLFLLVHLVGGQLETIARLLPYVICPLASQYQIKGVMFAEYLWLQYRSVITYRVCVVGGPNKQSRKVRGFKYSLQSSM